MSGVGAKMLAFDRNLFNRMTFNVDLCCDADDLRRHIEWGGGCVTSTSVDEEGPYTITLVNSRESVSHSKWSKDLFLSSFIFKCGADNKLHSLKTFWIKSGRFNNDFQPDDILLQKLTWHEAFKEFSAVQSVNDIQLVSGSPLLLALKGRYPVVPLGRCDAPTKIKKRQRNEYSEQERNQIVAAIVKNNWYEKLKDAQMWRQMEEEFPRHTWQSLKNHFLRRIVPFISDYNLSSRIIKKIRSQCSYKNDNLSTSNSESQESSDELGTKPIKSKKYRKWSSVKEDEESSDSSPSVQSRKLPQRGRRQIFSSPSSSSNSHDDQISEQKSEVQENNAVSHEWMEDQSISQYITERGSSTVSEKDKLIREPKGGTVGNVSFESSCSKQSHSKFPVGHRATKNNSLTRDLNFVTHHKCSQPSLLKSVPLVNPEGSVQEQGVTENCDSSGALFCVEGEESDEEAASVTHSEWSQDGTLFRGCVSKSHKQLVNAKKSTDVDMSCVSPADASLPFPENSEAGNAKNSTESFGLVNMFAERENSKCISTSKNHKDLGVQCDFIPTNDAAVQTDPVIFFCSESSADESEGTPLAITGTPEQLPESQSLPSCFAKKSEFLEKESMNKSFSARQDDSESSGTGPFSGWTEVAQPTPSDRKEEENVNASPSKLRGEILVDIDQSQDVTTSPGKKKKVLPKTPPPQNANERLTRNRAKQDKRQTRSTAKHD